MYLTLLITYYPPHNIDKNDILYKYCAANDTC